MDKLTHSQREKIHLLQKKVDKYQTVPLLCAALTPKQCAMLAELQIIYDNLSNQTLVNHAAIFNTVCKAVKDQMKQFSSTYTNMQPEQLYYLYLRKYKEAKTGANDTDRLDKLDVILSEDLNETPKLNDSVPKT